MKVPVYIQMQCGENGATALSMILAYYKKYVSLQEIEKICISSRNGTSPKEFCNAACHYGLDCKQVNMSFDDILNTKKSQLPLVIRFKYKGYAIITKISKYTITLNDPSKGSITITHQKFKDFFKNIAFIIKPTKDFKKGGKKTTMLDLLKPRLLNHKLPIIVISIIIVVITFINIFYIALTKELIDNVMSGQEPDWFIPCSVLLAITFLAASGFRIFNTVLQFSTSRNMAAESGSKLFYKLINLPITYYEKRYCGELINRLTSDQLFNNTLIKTLIPNTIEAILTLCYLTILFYYNIPITVIILILEAIYLFATYVLRRQISIISRSVATSTGDMDNYVFQGLNMIETIKSTASEQRFFTAWESTQNQQLEARLKLQKRNMWYGFLTNLHTTFSSAIILFFGAYLIINNQYTLGMLFAFQSIFGNVKFSINNFTNVLNTAQRLKTNLERVDDIVKRDTNKEIPLPKNYNGDKFKGDINVSGLYYKYNQGDDYALKNVNLKVKQGQIIGLVGVSGCGKTTLMNCISGLYTPKKGVILYDNLTRDKIPDKVFHTSLATVDQETTIFNDTIRENLSMWDTTITQYDILPACRNAQIHERIIKEKEAYNARFLENGKNFSTGELQRFELARSLCQNPTVLLLDEFTSALDSLTEQKVFNAIRMEGITCIIAAHRFSTVVECDKIYVMEKGEIVGSGTHKELYSNNNLYRQLIDIK